MAFGVPANMVDVFTGVLLSVPLYWAWMYRIRPAAYAHLHRSINSEEDILQWVERQLVLAAEMIGAMLFAYVETVGCYWALDDQNELLTDTSECTNTAFYSVTFGNTLLVMLITKLVFIDSGLADLGHLLEMDVPTGPKIAVLGLWGQCVCVLYLAATKEYTMFTDIGVWNSYIAMFLVWLSAVALGVPWTALIEGTYVSPQRRETARRSDTRTRATTGGVEMGTLDLNGTATTTVMNPIICMHGEKDTTNIESFESRTSTFSKNKPSRRSTINVLEAAAEEEKARANEADLCPRAIVTARRSSMNDVAV